MPNGKPGDHPFTDIVVHRATVFGEPVDGLIREIARSAQGELREVLAALAWSWPTDAEGRPIQPHGFLAVLKALKLAVDHAAGEGRP